MSNTTSHQPPVLSIDRERVRELFGAMDQRRLRVLREVIDDLLAGRVATQQPQKRRRAKQA